MVICVSIKSKYLSSAFLLLLTSVIVKIIGAVYKIPLTSFIGAVGRGYFATAYNLCLPLHAVIMGAFPVALSRLTSKYNASGNKEAVSAVKKGSFRLFFIVGIVGTAVMLIAAKPYSVYIAASPKSLYTILVLTPSIFFSALAASYRGYYEGFMNMHPTSVSQTIEAFFKMIFGLIFARLSMSYLYNAYLKTGMVLGESAAGEEEALSLIYPLTSAAAMLGVTLGSVISLLYVWVYHQINKTGETVCDKSKTRLVQKELLAFSLPIMISCAVQSVFQFLDTATVQLALGMINQQDLKDIYAECLKSASTADDDIATYIYGLLSSAIDFKNLIPGITMALGICAVPAISSACEARNTDHLSGLINSIYKYTSLISAAGGIVLALCSRDILTFFYGISAPDIVIGCDTLVKYFALTVPVYSLAGTAVFCVQAIGVPQKSIAPYVASGIIRVVLNIILVSNERFILMGCVLAGAAGYFVMFVWNVVVVKKVSKTKFDLKNVVIKPAIISIVSYFLLNYIFKFINPGSNLLIYLLIKFTVCALVFCMLCFIFRAVDLNEITFYRKCKKNGLNT